MSAVTSWFTQASREQKRKLLGASLGWMLNSMDAMLCALVLGEVQRELHLSAAASGPKCPPCWSRRSPAGLVLAGLQTALVESARLPEAFVYSIGTALCGLTHAALQRMLCRVVLGLGMGGEWASGAALVAETWPDRHRGKALAVVQSSWAMGFALGAGVVAIVMPRFGWRAVFFAGIAPGLITLWFQRSLREPETWQHERTKQVRFSQLFRAPRDVGLRHHACIGFFPIPADCNRITTSHRIEL